MDFVVAPFNGTVPEAVAELTRPDSHHFLVVLSGKFSWLWVRNRWTRVELREFDRPEDVLVAIRRKRRAVVAVEDDGRWDRAMIATLIGSLRQRDKRVVLFTSPSADLSELASVEPTIAVISDHRHWTVIGTPAGAAAGRAVRIFDLERAFASRFPQLPRMGTGPGHAGMVGTTPAGGSVPIRPRSPEPPSRPTVRCVNTLIVPPGGGVETAVTAPLAAGTKFEVLLNIGPRLAGSLLPEPDAGWPGEQLPGGDLKLRALLSMAGMPVPLVSEFTLPATGAGPLVRLPVTTPAREQVWTGELVIYYEVVAVHAQRLVLPVGIAGGPGPHAELLYRLTRSFADLGALRERTASVLVTDGGARALVNGVRFADNPVWINANAADNAVRAARALLHDKHLKAARSGYASTLDGRYGKDFPAFTEDLANLARHGAVLYDRLFRDNTVFDTLPELIRHEAAARGWPAVLNVADPTIGDPDRAHPVPWSMVYDLRIPQDPGAEFWLCPSMRRFGPGGSERWIPAHCPEPDHAGNVLCPFGFWGLSSVIEQPPSTDALVWSVFDGAAPTAVAIAVDPGLDGKLTERHLTSLRDQLGTARVTAATVRSAEELARSLAGETMDVAYLYCHGGYHKLADNALPSPVLRFGRSVVDPVEVGNWRRDPTLWPRPHWPRRKPLVVLNGCHTAELTTATLSNFVDAFANRAGAAGVIGTEVSVEQGMAGWVAEMLLWRLVNGASAGQALRQVRWRMLNRGNVMGLAYTLYGAAGLRLRPISEVGFLQ